MNKKKIIFAAPLHYSLSEVIVKELESLGFDVIDISYYGSPFKYESFVERIKCFLHRNILGKKDYKIILELNRNKKKIFEKISFVKEADYAFIIRADVFTVDIIKEIKNKAIKTIAYQWDGLDRFPNIIKLIPLFDSFFVFDKKDLTVNGTKFTTNFYPEAINTADTHHESDIYYTGSYNKKRILQLEKIIKYAQELKLKTDYLLFAKKESTQKKSILKITQNTINYFQNIERIQHTKVLIDVVNPSHEGLSFRTFESIGFRKKLITTNKSISQYDFYNPNNILIWDELKTADDLKNFMDMPYVDLDENIRLKYGFRNWIKYMLDEPPYIDLK